MRVAVTVLALLSAGCAAVDRHSAPPPTSPADALRPYYATLGDFPVMPVAAPAPRGAISRIAFGSCLHQDRPAPILDAVVASDADLLVMLGDNVYGDADAGDMSLPELRAAYAALGASQEFRNLAAAVPIQAVWDDHDYGLNDAGADFSAKELAQKMFNAFWCVPAGDPRRNRDGVYSSAIYGSGDRAVQLILLDTRFFRSPLQPTDARGAPGRERYLPAQDAGRTLLGESQWRWLEAELRKPAAIKVLVSSIQVIADGHGWEAWRTLPHERQRLYDLIDTVDPAGLVIVSGDRHRAGFYARGRGANYPLYELTTSSLNLSFPGDEEPGPFRLDGTYRDENFGTLEVDWDRGRMTLAIHASDGDVRQDLTLELAAMR